MQLMVSTVTMLALMCTAVSAQPLDDLRKDGHNTDNILTYGVGYHQHAIARFWITTHLLYATGYDPP